MSRPSHPALDLSPGLYEAEAFPIADGFLPIEVANRADWAEWDPSEGARYQITDPIRYYDEHGPLRPINPQEVPGL